MASALTPHRPITGVAVFITNESGQFLFGKRKGSHGTGTWGLPGGHLEYLETFEQCSERETLEECGLQIRNSTFLTATNDVHEREQRHGITIFMTAQLADEAAEARVMEPDKCEGWRWQGFGAIVDAWAAKKGGGVVEEEYFLPLYGLVEQRPDVAEMLKEGKV